MYWETTSSSMKSRGVVIKSLMWLFERRKTRCKIVQAVLTERCLVLNILNQDGNGLNDLDLDLVATVLFYNANNIL